MADAKRERLRAMARGGVLGVRPDRWAAGATRVALHLYYLTRLSAWLRASDGGRPLSREMSRSNAQEPDRWDLYDHVIDCYDLAHSAITYLEFGVHEGESLKWWVERNDHPDSTFVGFDSFEGLPENWNRSAPAGRFSTGGVIPDIADPRCSIVKGLFQDTLLDWLAGRQWPGRVVCMMDADLYASTLYPLILLGQRLRPGDILIFDEFRDVRNEFRAFCDWQACSGAKAECVASVREYSQVALVVR